ncbi:hypothetical protein, partial [Streptomyces sp. SYSU K217416]
MLDVIAARAARRIWREACEDFARVVAGRDLAEVWRRAMSLVLPLELHPVRADSRHARADYIGAVRQVAENLAAQGLDAVSAVQLADRLRHGLGLPPRLRGGAPGRPPVGWEQDVGQASSAAGGRAVSGLDFPGAPVAEVGSLSIGGERGLLPGFPLVMVDGAWVLPDPVLLLGEGQAFTEDGSLAASPSLHWGAVLGLGGYAGRPLVADLLGAPLAGGVMANLWGRGVLETASGEDPLWVAGHEGDGDRWQLADGDRWVLFLPEPSWEELG